MVEEGEDGGPCACVLGGRKKQVSRSKKYVEEYTGGNMYIKTRMHYVVRIKIHNRMYTHVKTLPTSRFGSFFSAMLNWHIVSPIAALNCSKNTIYTSMFQPHNLAY